MSGEYYRVQREKHSRPRIDEEGNYIDQFTTVPDTRTTKQVLSRLPKCLTRKKGKVILRNAKHNPATDS